MQLEGAAIGTGDKFYYSGEADAIVQDGDRLKGQGRLIEYYFSRFEPVLDQFVSGRTGLTAMELGAGSCMMSLAVSRHPGIGRITCSDISMSRMQSLLPVAERFVPGASGKIDFLEFDFSGKFPVESNSKDIILFSAALHHSRSMWDTLSECRRVLRPGGIVIAQAEQYLARLTYGYALRRLLDSEEVKSGVSENTFLKEQYGYYFSVAGFQATFIPCYPSLPFKALFFLNGLLFSKWVLVARKMD